MRNRLIKLLADNRTCAARCFAVRVLDKATADAPSEVEVLLYDAIVDSQVEAEWFGGVAADAFVAEIRAIKADIIHLRINSPGGSVFGARAMETALREHPATVVAHIDALAASAASFLAMAADEIVMSKGAMVMIHKAWTFAMGNAIDLKATAALLDKIDGTLVTTYADRTQQSAADIDAWMAAETWFTAAEAVDHGFADRIAEHAPKAQAAWNLSAYSNAPSAPVASPPASEPAYATADHRARQHQRARALMFAPIE